MVNEQNTPSVEILHQMPYSELKKIAKQCGIKGNLKAEKIIAALASRDSEDSFSTPAAKEINSSHKKKIEKLDEDSKTPLATPRRGTYSIGSPIVLKVIEATPSSIVNESSVMDESSALDMSNVTVGRGSERKLRNRKVSFLSPIMAPHTPRNSNLKMRPKTPIVSKTPLTAAISPSPMKECKVNLGKRVDTLTPLQKGVSDAELTRSFLNKSELSKKKRLETPNFKKIHEKAFKKMESIDDYQKRIFNSAKKMGVLDFKTNKIMKAKSKIPAFGGIPFIPSVSKCNTTKWDSSVVKSKKMEEKKKPRRDVENVNTRSKTKFDLKASLSRKLGYKPYTGKLKPLTPSSQLNISAACVHRSKETPANKVVASNRMQNRSVLKGVRTNKRFELQMKNRKIE